MGMDDLVQDRAYDEAIPVDSDDEEERSTPASSEADTPASAKTPQRPHAQKTKGLQQDNRGGSDSEASGSEETSSTSDDSDDDDNDSPKAKASLPSGAYNPEDFKGMQVSADIEELFQFITRYNPHTIELETTLKPFVPELIPSIGEVDAFLKMPRPDNESTGLGTTRLDEPTLNPTDPSILDLQLRSLSKNQDLEPMEVRCIENAEKCPKETEMWIKRIHELNRSKPAPTVQYQRRMPDIEQLMQVWPAEFEEFLQQNSLPELADLELDLPSYIRVMASILDVPVYEEITEALHVIFTLYSEFKSNQHFSKTDTAGNFGTADQYNFPSVPNFNQGATAAMSNGATGTIFGGPTSESIAPSRAPSPIGKGGAGHAR